MLKINFIVGTGRCGTNLLNKMLRFHPDLTPVTETHFISTLASIYKEANLSTEQFWEVINTHYTTGSRRWIDLHLEAGGIADKQQFKNHFIQTCREASYTTHTQRISVFFDHCYGNGKTPTSLSIIDKTPQYGIQMSAITNVFPQAKFIHLIRDGRFVATSIIKHLGICRLIRGGHPDRLENFSYQNKLEQIPALPVTLEEAIEYWAKTIVRIRQEATLLPASQYMELRYEDLILHPKKTMQQVEGFLGIPYGKWWKWRASLVPKPDALVNELSRLSPQEFEKLTSLVQKNLEMQGYFTGSFEDLLKQKHLYIPDKMRLRKLWRNQSQKTNP